jgi:DNA polymerase I-like protein with 3'-5' exonuclease and polymerase domains
MGAQEAKHTSGRDMTLYSGQRALDALQEAFSGISSFPVVEIDPEGRARKTTRVMAVYTPERHVLLEPAKTPDLGKLLSEQKILGAHDAKQVHRALLALGQPTLVRWACSALSERLLSGGRWWECDLDSIAKRLDEPPPPQAESGLDALVQRARLTYGILTKQMGDLKKQRLTWTSKIEAACVGAVASMEYQGMSCDGDLWSKLNAEATAERNTLADALQRDFAASGSGDLFGRSHLNLDSDAELKSALHALNLRVPNVKRATLAQLPEPWGKRLSRYREVSKLVSTYGEGFARWITPDHRIRPNFSQIGASTGRMACDSPNLQAVVKGSSFRDCFHAPAGRTFIIADYATCELRILAQMSRDPVFCAAFARGDDLHATVASSMFNEKVTKTQHADLRQRAKAINFGLVYGMGAAALGRQLGVDTAKAKKLLERYFQTFPRIRTYLEATAEDALKKGYAQTLTGRRLYLEIDERGHSRAQAQRVAKNMPIQGTSADITKHALGQLYIALADFPDTFLVNAVHDEIVVECPEDLAQKVRDLTVETMVNAAQSIVRDVPMAVDAQISRVWDK